MSSAHSAQALRVLVVDDHQMIAQFTARLLRKAGYEVETAEDSETALAAALEFRPDVIFLDIGLPGMSGYEVAERLRQQEETRHATLVAMTGYGTAADRRRTAEAGFDHHLVKPVPYQMFLDLLGHVRAA